MSRRSSLGSDFANAVAAIFVVLALTGCQSTSAGQARTPAIARLFLESADGTVTATLPKSGVRIAIGARAILTEDDIVGAEHARVDLGDCLVLQLTTAAARDLYRLSVMNQGRRLVLMVNDVAIGARRIDGPLADGTIFIFAEVADTELPKLVHDLKITSAALQKELGKKS